jgi:hypothetical protein
MRKEILSQRSKGKTLKRVVLVSRPVGGVVMSVLFYFTITPLWGFVSLIFFRSNYVTPSGFSP